ncbi:hypothetical protein ACLOJK_030258 [Asimina triloba]
MVHTRGRVGLQDFDPFYYSGRFGLAMSRPISTRPDPTRIQKSPNELSHRKFAIDPFGHSHSLSLSRASSSSAFVGAFPIPPSPFHPSAVSFSGLSSGFPALAVNLLPLPSESRPHPTPVVFLAPSPFRPHLAPAVFLAPCSLPATPYSLSLPAIPCSPPPLEIFCLLPFRSSTSASASISHLRLRLRLAFISHLRLHLSPPPPPRLHLAPPPPSRAPPPSVEIFRRDLASRSGVEFCCRDLVSVEISRRDLLPRFGFRRDLLSRSGFRRDRVFATPFARYKFI